MAQERDSHADTVAAGPPRPISAAAAVGDLLVIEIAGAYGFVMASNYNSKPLPAEVLVDGGRGRLVRARQSVEDLVRGEAV